MSEQIRLTWYVKNQHTETFTPEEFSEWLDANHIDVADPTDLDEVYSELDGGAWRAEEALIEAAANNRTWVDTTDPELIDLTLEGDAR